MSEIDARMKSLERDYLSPPLAPCRLPRGRGYRRPTSPAMATQAVSAAFRG